MKIGKGTRVHGMSILAWAIPFAMIAGGFLPLRAEAVEIPSPESFVGHKIGEDGKLVPYPKVVEYFHKLDAASDRVTVEVAGKSTLGNDMLVVVLTSERNQKNLEHYRSIARRLANPDDLSEEEAQRLIAEGKTIVLVTCSIHSTEVGSTQMSLEFAHDVATTRDPSMLRWLDDVTRISVLKLQS